MNFIRDLSRISSFILNLSSILHASNMKCIFEQPPRVSFRRVKNLKEELVRSRIRILDDGRKGMVKCGKSRCQICSFVEEGVVFEDNSGERSYVINYRLNCDSKGIVYLIMCRKYLKQYVGSTITWFRTRFNNHKSSLGRYEKGMQNMPGEHLYEHFYGEGRGGLNDVTVKIIGKTDVSQPTIREIEVK